MGDYTHHLLVCSLIHENPLILQLLSWCMRGTTSLFPSTYLTCEWSLTCQLICDDIRSIYEGTIRKESKETLNTFLEELTNILEQQDNPHEQDCPLDD